MTKASIAKLDDLRPQRRNANRHSERGMGRLEASMRADGYLTPMTAAADGEVFDGSARLETAAELFGGVEPIVVESDGTRPIVHVRTDIPTADDPRAVRLAVAANRVAELNLSWDPGVLAELRDEGALDQCFTAEEVEALLAGAPGADEWGAALSLPDGDRAPFQQMTFTLSDEQAEQVKAAMERAKAAGPFVDTGNENGNGNALARICEAYRG